MRELRIRIKDGGEVAYDGETGLEAVRKAMMAELGPACEDVEADIMDPDKDLY